MVIRDNVTCVLRKKPVRLNEPNVSILESPAVLILINGDVLGSSVNTA